MMMLAPLLYLQEVATEVVEAVDVVAGPVADGLTIQAIAALLLPVVIQLLKRIIPQMEGKSLFYLNLILNLAVAIAAMMGLDVPPAEAMTIGLAGGLAGSKIADITKRRTVVISPRHK